MSLTQIDHLAKPHTAANCPYAVITDISCGQKPQELIIRFVVGLRTIPVAVPHVSDLFHYQLVKRLAWRQHGIRLKFHFETMLSSPKDRVGFFRLLIVDAFCERSDRVRSANEQRQRKEQGHSPSIQMCGGHSHA